MAGFDEWAEDLRKRIQNIAGQGATIRPSRPAETADGVLYCECYRYFRTLKRNGGVDRLAAHLTSQPGGRWVRHKRNGVENVLRLLERPGEPVFIQPSRRGRIAAELSFADSYDIHSSLLLAFLYEAGSHQRILVAARAERTERWVQKYRELSNMIRQKAASQKRCKQLKRKVKQIN